MSTLINRDLSFLTNNVPIFQVLLSRREDQCQDVPTAHSGMNLQMNILQTLTRSWKDPENVDAPFIIVDPKRRNRVTIKMRLRQRQRVSVNEKDFCDRAPAVTGITSRKDLREGRLRRRPLVVHNGDTRGPNEPTSGEREDSGRHRKKKVGHPTTKYDLSRPKTEPRRPRLSRGPGPGGRCVEAIDHFVVRSIRNDS